MTPAVFEMRLLAATYSLPGVVCLVAAALGAVDRTQVLAGLLVGLPVFVGLLWLVTGRRFASEVVDEAQPVPPGTEFASPRMIARRVLAVQVPAIAICCVLVFLSPGVAGVILGGSIYWLLLAARLRARERATDRRYVHELRYRWRGTGTRRSGRGWFDPADFYVLEP